MFYLRLPARVDGVFVDFSVVLGLDEVEGSIVTERSPLSIDDHLLRVLPVAVPLLHVLQALDVTRVGTRAWNTE